MTGCGEKLYITGAVGTVIVGGGLSVKFMRSSEVEEVVLLLLCVERQDTGDNYPICGVSQCIKKVGQRIGTQIQTPYFIPFFSVF